MTDPARPARRPTTDWPRIWPIFDATVRAGETYAYPLDLTSEQARDLWLEQPPGLTVVLEEDGAILGSAKMGPNRPGPATTSAPPRSWSPRPRAAAASAAGSREYVVQWHRDQGFRGIQFNAVVETNEPPYASGRSSASRSSAPCRGRSAHPRAGTSACT